MAYNFYGGLFNVPGNKGINNYNSTLYASFTEYSSIKSGSYRKLLNAYYGKTGLKDDNTQLDKVINKDKTKDKSLTSVKTKADNLYDAATKLYTKGSDSVFNEDEKSVKSFVKKFVSDYNDFITATDKSTTKSVTKSADNLVNQVKMYEVSLEKIGITVDDAGKLSVSDSTFEKADKDSIADVFKGIGSLAYQIAVKASQIGQSAVNATSAFYGDKGNALGYNFSNSFEDFF